MAKPWQQTNNRLDITKEPGDREAEGGGEGEVTGILGKEGEGKQEKETEDQNPPPPPQRCK